MISETISEHIKRESKKREIGVYYPSRLPYCLRQQYYEWTLSYPHPEDTLRIFEVGNIFHSWLEKVFSRNGSGIRLLSSEKPISIYIAEHDYFINGRIDDIILVEKDGKTYLVEVKTYKDLQFLREPKREHVLQLNFYLKPYSDSDGIIFYIEKNTLQTKEFFTRFDQKLFKEIIDRAQCLHESLQSKTLPFPEGKQKKSWECRFCIYKNKCNTE